MPIESVENEVMPLQLANDEDHEVIAVIPVALNVVMPAAALKNDTPLILPRTSIEQVKTLFRVDRNVVPSIDSTKIVPVGVFVAVAFAA